MHTQRSGLSLRPLRPRLPWLRISALLLACLHALLAGWAVLFLSPRVPYADTWRFDAQLLQHPFPLNVLMVDNGHMQILPRLLRWLELQQGHGTQWPTILCGLALLLTAAMLWGSAARAGTQQLRLSGSPRQSWKDARLAWVLVGICGLFWLGNSRTLAHGNESLHAALVLVCLFAALRLISRPGKARLAVAMALALLASLSFGTGVAVFAGLLAVLWVRRAAFPALLVVLAGTVATASMLALLPGGDNAISGINLKPWLQLQMASRWLASPWLLAGGPLVDSSLLPHLPRWLRGGVAPIAHASTAMFGPARVAVWPQQALGLAGMVSLLALTWLARMRPTQATACERLALGISWFAVACAGLVALSRSEYFLLHPEQVYASRYAIWVSMFWAGLLGSLLCRLQQRGQHRKALLIALLTAILLLPSTTWMGLRAVHMSQIASRDAIDLRFGVIDLDRPHGENQIADMLLARPLLLDARVPPFGPRIGTLPGHRPPHAETALPVIALSMKPIDNALPTTAARVHFRLPRSNAKRVLLLDHRQRVAGFATAKRHGKGWHGLVTGQPRTLLVLPCQKDIRCP